VRPMAPDSLPALSPTRRGLLRGAAAGSFLLGVQFATGHVAFAAEAAPAVFAPDAFIRITPDGQITFIMCQVEMGQGVYTALTMVMAEELDVDLDQVTLEAAPPDDKLYGNPFLIIQVTGGSTSIRGFWMPLRKAGATARAMLVQAAAAKWRVPADECRTEAGMVYHDSSQRSASYGSLAAKAATLTPPANVALKDPAQFRLIGQSQHRVDSPVKVNGALKYGIDATPPGLQFAALKSSPVPGGKLTAVDDSRLSSVPGARQVLRFDDMVAVVGDHSWAVLRGLAVLGLSWDDGPHAGLTTDNLRQGLHDAAGGTPVVALEKGHPQDILKGDGVISASYDFPLLAHAPMEPMNCTLQVTQDGAEVWVGTQVITKTQNIVAETAGLQPAQVIVHNHLLGGGFGRRLEVDHVRKATLIAMKLDTPVKVLWSREEDISQAMYRSLYGVWLDAKLENGTPVAWRHRVVGPSIIARWLPIAFQNGLDVDAVDGAVETPYDFPNMRVEYVRHELPAIPTCFWRGVGPNVNVFAIESFVDRLANEIRTDPVAFRRLMLKDDPRGQAVLDLATQKAGWGNPLPARSGRGVSLQFAFGSYLCTVAEVAVDDDGTVHVKRLTTAVDCGMPVNPDGIQAQVQGGLVFGLSAILYDSITVEHGRVQQSNFNNYRVMRIDEMPHIEVLLMKNAEPPGGLGEPGTVSVQPAVANAIYAATGVQLTRLPVDASLLVKSANS
jgi:isoquinoline 1-oxidoreductase subunit beta